MLNIDKFLKEQKREEEIRCPYCDGFYDISEIETDIGLITLWGGDNVIQLECLHCEKKFDIIEKVRRTFEIYRDCSSVGRALA